MSTDFAVFDPAAAPRDGKAFRTWYDLQMDWDLDGDDPAPETLMPPLLEWYRAMVVQFPDMVRSGANGDDAIDYCFTPHFIYCSMASTRSADEAWKLAKSLAQNLMIGTYDPMSDNGRDNRCIAFPDGPLPNDPSWFSRIFGKSKG